MDIRHLTYFVELAKQLNFTKAAAVLHISQPSLSKTIKYMEDTLNVTLFKRHARQLQLTDAGHALLANAKDVLQAYQNLKTELNDVIHLEKGEVKIGIPPIIGAAYCAHMINNFIENHPGIDITLREVGTKTITEEVEDGSLDIGFICSRPIKKGQYEVTQLQKDPLMLMTHKDHPLARRESIDFTDIKDQRFIMYRSDFSLYDSILTECANHHFTPHIVCESSQKDFMLEMVEARLGVALLPKKICEQTLNKEIVSIPFENPTIHLELGVIWGKNKYLPFAVREFLSNFDSISL